MSNVSVLRKDHGEEVLDELHSLVERVEMFLKCETRLTEKQLGIIIECKNLLMEVLAQPRGPNAGEFVPNIKKKSIEWAAQAWLDGRSQHLEEALQNKTTEECHEIEEKAVLLLRSQVPKYAWRHHQKQLAARVLKRVEQQFENVTLYDLPKQVKVQLSNFKPFKRGDKFKYKKYHEFQWGEKVVTSKKSKRTYAFVYHETDRFVYMIDKNGNEFHKKKSNVQVITKRERIIDRTVRQFDF